jgi:hypothetical protein
VIVKAFAILFVSSLTVVGVAGAQEPASYNLTATLTTNAEVPRPTGVKASTRGTFTGTAVLPSSPYARVVITWKLTFANLTGPARRAFIHRVHSRGGPGKVLFPLCYPCRNGHSGKGSTSRQYLRLILAGKAYVNVYTSKNQDGEIRGELKFAKTT